MRKVNATESNGLLSSLSLFLCLTQNRDIFLSVTPFLFKGSLMVETSLYFQAKTALIEECFNKNI